MAIMPWLDVMVFDKDKRSSFLIFSGADKSQREMLSQNFFLQEVGLWNKFYRI